MILFTAFFATLVFLLNSAMAAFGALAAVGVFVVIFLTLIAGAFQGWTQTA